MKFTNRLGKSYFFFNIITSRKMKLFTWLFPLYCIKMCNKAVFYCLYCTYSAENLGIAIKPTSVHMCQSKKHCSIDIEKYFNSV